MNGKRKCKILKQIRAEIAKRNDIDYVTSECQYQGDCTGTCPKCEGEVRYLEQELHKRRQAGKTVAVVGIAAALMLGSVGCAGSEIPETTSPEQTQSTTDTQVDGEMVIGELPYEETEPWEGELSSEETEPMEFMGVPMDTTEELLLTGDVAYPEEAWTD